MSDTISACKCGDLPSTEPTLTLSHNLNDNVTTMTFTDASQSFSYSVKDDTNIIKQALEETILSL